MIRNRNKAGFTLIELMIVVAIIAIIASVAIPKLMSARLAANESAAISTLRSISSAQAQIQSASAIDTDGDGSGEYGYFAELAGAAPLRIFGGVGVGPAAGVANVDELDPSMLSAAFGNLTADVAGDGVVTRSGYVFKMWLPVAGSPAGPLGEDAAGGKAAAPFPGSDNGEILWAAYAWPIEANATGNRVFFVNQEGDLFQMNNRIAAPYEGVIGATANPPAADAIFDALQPGDLGAPLGINGTAAVDGNLWVAVQ